MTTTKIHLVVAMQEIILLVFYTETDCWQLRVISAGGVIFGERKLYFTPEAAEKAGREWIEQGY